MKPSKTKLAVQSLLTKYDVLKDDDDKLIANYWAQQLKEKSKDINTMSAIELMKIIADGKILSKPESIRRTRQKLQETIPSLRGKLYFDRHAAQDETKKDLRTQF